MQNNKNAVLVENKSNIEIRIYEDQEIVNKTIKYFESKGIQYTSFTFSNKDKSKNLLNDLKDKFPNKNESVTESTNYCFLNYPLERKKELTEMAFREFF